MNPMMLKILLGLGMGGGFLFHDNPTGRMSDQFNAARGLINPTTIGADATKFFNEFMQSPAYLNAAKGIIGSANAGQAGVEQNFAKMFGSAQSGIRSLAPLGSGAAASGLGSLQSNAWQSAVQQAMQLPGTQMGFAGSVAPQKFTGADQYANILDMLKWYMLLQGHK